MGAADEIARLDFVEKNKIEALLEAPVLPQVSSTDNGKVLRVSGGKWVKGDETVELPEVSSDDNGKVLMVVEGEWAVASLPATTSQENIEG